MSRSTGLRRFRQGVVRPRRHSREKCSRPLPSPWTSISITSLSTSKGATASCASCIIPRRPTRRCTACEEGVDINLITLLVCSADGLEVLDMEGDWIPVKAHSQHLTVNVGDMQQNLTGGLLLHDTPRRVARRKRARVLSVQPAVLPASDGHHAPRPHHGRSGSPSMLDRRGFPRPSIERNRPEVTCSTSPLGRGMWWGPSS